MAVDRLHVYSVVEHACPGADDCAGSFIQIDVVDHHVPVDGWDGVSEYWLEVGTTANPQQFFAQGLTSLSATVSALPIDGSPVAVRLWSKINGAWQWTGYFYIAK